MTAEHTARTNTDTSGTSAELSDAEVQAAARAIIKADGNGRCLTASAPGPAGDRSLREYTREEVAAMHRQGLMDGKIDALCGAPFWATGDYWPNRATRQARDWQIIADALDREWKKHPIPIETETDHERA